MNQQKRFLKLICLLQRVFTAENEKQPFDVQFTTSHVCRINIVIVVIDELTYLTKRNTEEIV